ncbi:MAG: autotransporter outer membrane beta-barrel domain-containing protein [Alphaproteobacteria bacterium]|nr:autotransporter outer membrane beta-barrel domain-containing protein [Alphaproteobacteria bacterium]
MKVSLVSMLLATTFISTGAVAYEIEPTIENGVISYVEGSADDYNFTIQEPDADGNLTTLYYKINIDEDKFTPSSNVGWTILNNKPADRTNLIEIELPNNDVRYFEYSYYEPGGYTDATRIEDTSTLTEDDLAYKIFRNLTSSTDGGAIYNDKQHQMLTIPNDFINNTADGNGGAIYNEYNIGGVSGNFIGNHSVDGGAVYNRREGTINSIGGNFVKNYAINDIDGAWGGAVSNDGTVGDINANFIGNYANSSDTAHGGAISNYSNGEGGKIDGITGIFVANYAYGNDAHGGGIYNNGSIEYITGDFISNYVQSSTTSYGGAIYSESSIESIEGDFINNYAKGSNAHGGAINNASLITDIKGNFIGNYTYAIESYGGAIINDNENDGAYIGRITGDFINNYASAPDSGFARGGAIYNDDVNSNSNYYSNFIGNYATSQGTAEGGAIYNNELFGGGIFGDFIGNYTYGENQGSRGGAIYTSNDQINKIEGNFVGNYATGISGGAEGGALYITNNSGVNSIIGNFIENYVKPPYDEIQSNTVKGGAIANYGNIDSITGDFIGNYAEAVDGAAFGGAIYNEGDITLLAKENGASVIKDNYVKDSNDRRAEAIYMGNSDASLTLKADNNGTIEVYDIINGVSGYDVTLTGDGTGSVSLFNNVTNADITANNVAVNLSDGDVKNYTFNSLTSNDTVNWSIDVKLDSGEADTITSTTSSSGTVYIDRINDFGYNNEEITIQVLKNLDNNSDLQLALNEDNFIIRNDGFVIENDVDFSKTYIKEWGITLATTDTTNDSIKIKSKSIFDSLALLNAKETTEERSFIFDIAGTYSLSENLVPTTAGTLNIKGFNNDAESSVINASGYDLFNLSNATTLNVEGVTLSNASDNAISISSDESKLNLTDVILKNNGGDAINVSSQAEIKLTNVELKNNEGNAINISGQADVNLINVLIENNANNAINVSDQTNLNLTDVTLKNNGGDAINVSSQAEINLTNVLFENNSGNAITSSGNVNLNAKDTDIEMNENIVMNDAKLSLYAENGTLGLSNKISGNNYDLYLKGGNINVNNSISDVNNLELSSSAVLGLGKNSSINVTNMMHAQDTAPISLQSNSSPTLKIDIDIANNTITNGIINVSGDVSGTYNVIVNALSSGYSTQSSVFLNAKNDDMSTSSEFSVLRVDGSPYMWKTILNANGETVGSTWYLTTEKTSSAPEIIAGIGLQRAGIEQTRSVVRNVANKTVNKNANKRKRVYNPPRRNQWGWTIIDKKGHIDNNSPQDNVWVFAQGEYANIDTPVETEAQIWGIEGGFDLQSNANNTLGIFASYRNGTYDLSGTGAELNANLTSEIGIDSYLAGLYYRYDNNKFYTFATLYGGMQQAEATTEDGAASFETDGIEFGASAEIGYSFALSRTATLTPSLGIFYTQVNFDEAEDNVGKTYEWDDISNIEAELGLNFTQNIGRSKVYVKPSVVQTFVNGNEVMITGLEAIETADNQTLGRIEIGGRLGITDNLYGYGWANYTFSSDYNSASLGAGLNYSW